MVGTPVRSRSRQSLPHHSGIHLARPAQGDRLPGLSLSLYFQAGPDHGQFLTRGCPTHRAAPSLPYSPSKARCVGMRRQNHRGPSRHPSTRVPWLCLLGPKVRGQMMEGKFSVAEIMLIAGTRAALGVGIGLLVAGHMNDDQRRSAGIALAVVGGLTTIPLVLNMISRSAQARAELRSGG